MAFLGSLLSAGLPLLGNIVKQVAPGLISKVSSILPDSIKPIVNAVAPGLVESGVNAITKAVENRGDKSAGDVLKEAGKGFLSSAVQHTKDTLTNINKNPELERTINNQLPVYVKSDSVKNNKTDKDQRKQFRQEIIEQIQSWKNKDPNPPNPLALKDEVDFFDAHNEIPVSEEKWGTFSEEQMTNWYIDSLKKRWLKMIDDKTRDPKKAMDMINEAIIHIDRGV